AREAAGRFRCASGYVKQPHSGRAMGSIARVLGEWLRGYRPSRARRIPGRMSAPAKQVAASQPAAVHRESLMLRFARAQTVELQGPGPFETPAVQAVLGVTSA